MPPEAHALLSASGASRWLKCTAAPRFEAEFPETTSEYAEEGRLAHAVCELKLLKTFTSTITPKAFTTRFNKLKKDALYKAEMDKTSDTYIEHLMDLVMGYSARPYIVAEVRVDFSDIVPEGFGTCDCIMIGGDLLTIVDYKHGQGVPVSAEKNPQMMLYAIGALKKYVAVYGDSIKRIRMCICQPRLNSDLSEFEMTVDELKAWCNSIKPIAEIAYSGNGEFCPGEHCRFCRGKNKCRARAEANMALEEFKNCLPDTLSDAEIGDLLMRGKDVVAWYNELKDYALDAALKGADIQGWKVVEGRSIRSFSDQEAAFEVIKASGYDEALLYERKPLTLSKIEDLMGKKEFADKVGHLVIKPAGSPTLAPSDDKRPPLNSAARDFSDIAGGAV